MLFKKEKKETALWTFQDTEYWILTKSLSTHRDELIAKCAQVITHEGCANMLPDGPDKDIELEKAQESREHVRNLLGAYEADLKEYNAIDITKLNHYTGRAEWAKPHEMLEIAWHNAISHLYK